MNTNDSNSSQNAKNPAQNPEEKPSESTPPIPAPLPPPSEPLSSPSEPTKAFPSDPSRTYSSDPSQYAYPHDKPASDESTKVYTTEPLDTARIATEDRRSADNQAQREKESFESRQQKTSETSRLKGDFYHYVASNREQTITYVLLILGLILILFANGLLGGLIIGMVTGYYFDAEIIHSLRNLGQILGGQNQLRYLVLAALALGLFIAAPGIFIGAIIVATFKQVMAGPQA